MLHRPSPLRRLSSDFKMKTTRFLIVIALTALVTGAHAQTSRFDPPDRRLDQKVTVQIIHTKLEDVAASLTKQSGVIVKAGTGTRDWKVRETRVTIQAKDIPLANALDDIATLLGYHISREGKDGEWTYIIWQDKKSRDLEAEMLTAEEEAAAKRASETRQAALDVAEKAAKMTPEEARKLRVSDPTLAYLGGTKSGRGYAQLFASLGQTERELVLRGKRVILPFESLSPALQQAAMDTASSGFLKEQGEGLTPLQIVISGLSGEASEGLGPLGVEGAIALMGIPSAGMPDYDPVLGLGQPMSAFLLGKPDSKFGKAFAGALTSLDEGASMDDFEKALDPFIEDESLSTEATARESATETAPPTDPELTREIELKLPAFKHWDPAYDAKLNGQTIEAISKATGFTVMLESFPDSGLIAPYLKPGKQPVYKIMIGLEKAGLSWKLEHSSLRIRPQDWATMRSYAIPESTLVRYRDALETMGALSLEDLAAMASELTDDQIDKRLFRDPDLSYAVTRPLGGWEGHRRDMLRLYHALSASQQAQLKTEKGLPFDRLTDDQWGRLGTMIADRLGGVYVVNGGLFLGQPEKVEDGGSYVFRAGVVTDADDVRMFSVTVLVQGKHDLAGLIATRIKAREKADAASGEPAK